MKSATKVKARIFQPWFTDGECSAKGVRVLLEKDGGRDEVFEELVQAAADHVVGLKVIESLGGFPKSAHLLMNRVPKGKISRSGILGEILATEFLD
jgi:hypothetical protein